MARYPSGNDLLCEERGARLRGALSRRLGKPPLRAGFIVKLDDGHGPDDPLHLVAEIKGFRGLDAQLKAETMKTLWVPGINNLGGFGRWAFVEFTDAFAIKDEYAALIAGLLLPKRKSA